MLALAHENDSESRYERIRVIFSYCDQPLTSLKPTLSKIIKLFLYWFPIIWSVNITCGSNNQYFKPTNSYLSSILIPDMISTTTWIWQTPCTVCKYLRKINVWSHLYYLHGENTYKLSRSYCNVVAVDRIYLYWKRCCFHSVLISMIILLDHTVDTLRSG